MDELERPEDGSGDPTAAYIANARAAATWRAYAAPWREFLAFCHKLGTAPPASPQLVARYLAERAGRLKPATLNKHLSAIIVHHRQAGLPFDRDHPMLREVIAGIHRTHGVAPTQKAALTVEEIVRLAALQPKTLAGLRNRALILLGFALAARRGELSALDRSDIRPVSSGLVVLIRRGKNDQVGRGHLKGVPFARSPEQCPVRALTAYMMAARLDDGPLFRTVDRHQNVGGRMSGEAISQVVKAAMVRLVLAEGGSRAAAERRATEIAGHSLRASFLTAAAAAHVPLYRLQQYSGHARASSLAPYLRRGGLFEANPVTEVL